MLNFNAMKEKHINDIKEIIQSEEENIKNVVEDFIDNLIESNFSELLYKSEFNEDDGDCVVFYIDNKTYIPSNYINEVIDKSVKQYSKYGLLIDYKTEHEFGYKTNNNKYIFIVNKITVKE